jgi:hypothetical protein
MLQINGYRTRIGSVGLYLLFILEPPIMKILVGYENRNGFGTKF